MATPSTKKTCGKATVAGAGITDVSRGLAVWPGRNFVTSTARYAITHHQEKAMCQQFENEQNYMFASERRTRKQQMEDHLSGKKVLTDEELTRLAVEELMARDAGF